MDNTKIKEQFNKMDELLYQTEKEFKKFRKINNKINKFEKKINVLRDFYHSDDWLEGRETLIEDGTIKTKFYSAGEDQIWNLSQSVHQEKIKILKTLIKTL